MSSRILLLLFLSMLLACSKTPSSCERCDREISITPCIDKHRQFKQGVVFNLESDAVEFIPITQIEPFHEAFLIEVDLIAVSERVVLISSEHGNYLFDIFGFVMLSLDEAEDPIVAKYGDRRFFGATEKVGDFKLDDTFSISNVVLQSKMIEFSLTGGAADSLFAVNSYLIADDTLATS
ncbi:MAG: hypothetical protein JJ895_11940 [Balneolaceae bacterium]|nr:hypothetical protein [Balneolaceae bacterium]